MREYLLYWGAFLLVTALIRVDARGQVVFTDNFDRLDLGPDWEITPRSGTVSIIDYPPDGKLELSHPLTDGTFTEAVLVGTGTLLSGDVSVAFDFDNGPSTRANNDTRIYIRYVDSSNQCYVDIGEDNFNSPSRIRVFIHCRVAGEGGIIADLRGVFVDPGRYEVALEGNQVTFRNVSGGTVINLTGTLDNLETLPAGRVKFAVNEEITAIDNVVLTRLVTEVVIDIKPGSDPNSINPNSKGVIPVAILTTSTADDEPLDFDATSVDPLSVEFGPDGASEAHGKGHIEDVDDDGDPDLVLHFKTQETGIKCGDTEATLTGQTFDGQPITGTDAIETVGCRGKGTRVAGTRIEQRSPRNFALAQNHPNPFNPMTRIGFQLPQNSRITLKIFNAVGEEVRALAQGPFPAGYHTVGWDAKDDDGNPVPSGVYFYVLRVGNYSKVKKMTLLR